MGLKELRAKKQELLNSAKELKEKDFKAAQEKLNEAKEIQNQIIELETFETELENQAKVQANNRAFEDNHKITNIYTKGVNVKEEEIMDTMNVEEIKDTTKTYEVAFAKNMLGMTLNNEEADVFNKVNADFRNATQTAEQHTVLIPKTVQEGIWREIGEVHPIFGDLAATGIKGDITILKEKNELDDAEWVDEKTKGKDEDLDFAELTLTGCELVKTIKISWKLKKMSIDAFLPYITSKLAEKMGNALAKGIISGKGKPAQGDNSFKPQARGIKTVLEAEDNTPQVVIYTSEITYDDLTTAMGKVKSGYSANACFYATNSTIWNQIAHIKDTTGRPIFIPDATLGGVGRLFGKIVKEEDAMKDGEILLGAINKGYIMNINEDMTIYTEDHIGDRATDYMGYAIVDGDVLTTKAFALIKK